MSDYRVGDEVKATYKGKVVEISGSKYVELWKGGPAITLLGDTEVKVTKRALPKVGDTVYGKEARELPAGSVVREPDDSGNVWRRYRRQWGSIFGGQDDSYGGPFPAQKYVVLYLPES